jgi:hypothetical protein
MEISMSNIDKFNELMAGASDAGRSQYEAAVSGMESAAQIGDAALKRNTAAVDQAAEHRKIMALQFARANALRCMR